MSLGFLPSLFAALITLRRRQQTANWQNQNQQEDPLSRRPVGNTAD
jgi:hypothetical protein